MVAWCIRCIVRAIYNRTIKGTLSYSLYVIIRRHPKEYNNIRSLTSFYNKIISINVFLSTFFANLWFRLQTYITLKHCHFSTTISTRITKIFSVFFWQTAPGSELGMSISRKHSGSRMGLLIYYIKMLILLNMTGNARWILAICGAETIHFPRKKMSYFAMFSAILCN